jgi:SAM-dependent methyltransferase
MARKVDLRHTGFDHVRAQWEVAGRSPYVESHVAALPAGVSFVESGARSALQLLDELPANPEVNLIEFGCGPGRVTQWLSQNFSLIYAVDISPAMLERVSALNLPNVVPVLSDGRGLIDKVPKVDAIYSEAVLMHNRKDDVRALFPELAACVREGGQILFQLPCYEVGREPEHWTDVGVWTRTELEDLARLAGCEVLRIWENPGALNFQAVGKNHMRLHVFQRRAACPV